MAYEIRHYESGYVRGCDDCNSEVPLDEFNSDRDFKWLCVFCSNMTGRPSDKISRMELAQAMNTMLTELKK